MLAEVSSNGKTDSITLPEFITAMEKSFREERLNTELLQSFEVFDIDGDGFITFSELKQVMADKFRASDVTDANIRAMIEKADTDGDGRVNYSGIPYHTLIVTTSLKHAKFMIKINITNISLRCQSSLKLHRDV